MQIKPSFYNIEVPLRRKQRAIYNSFTRSLAVLEAEDIELFDAVSHSQEIDPETEFARYMLSQGFLIPESVDETDIISKHYHESRFDSDVATLTICPTLSCNFTCDYCFQGGNKSIELMADEVKEGILSLCDKIISQDHITSLHVAWYGGEPLIKPKIIYDLADRMIELCEEKNVSYVSSIVTHGYFLTESVAKKLYERGLRMVQITIDGPEEMHNQRRQLGSGKGSYDTIIKNINSWIHTYPDLNVQIRVNIDSRNKATLEELVDDLHQEGFNKFPNFKMYFAPVESMTVGCHNVSDVTLKKLDYGMTETNLFYYAFEKGLAELPTPPMYLGICSAVKPHDFIITPSGDVHKCWDTVSFQKHAVGNVDRIDELVNIETPKLKEWSDFDPFKHKTCSTCKILPNCAGSCAFKFVNPEEGLGDTALPCPSMKYSINENIVKRCEVEGFLTKDDYDLDEIRTQPSAICKEVFDPKNLIIAISA